MVKDRKHRDISIYFILIERKPSTFLTHRNDQVSIFSRECVVDRSTSPLTKINIKTSDYSPKTISLSSIMPRFEDSTFSFRSILLLSIGAKKDSIGG
jgi:hypothetical protein